MIGASNFMVVDNIIEMKERLEEVKPGFDHRILSSITNRVQQQQRGGMGVAKILGPLHKIARKSDMKGEIPSRTCGESGTKTTKSFTYS